MSDVEPSEAGLASGVVNTSFMMGGALGLAVLASLAALAHRTACPPPARAQLAALTGGYHVAFLVGALFALAAAVIGGLLLREPARCTAAPEGRARRRAEPLRKEIYHVQGLEGVLHLLGGRHPARQAVLRRDARAGRHRRDGRARTASRGRRRGVRLPEARPPAGGLHRAQLPGRRRRRGGRQARCGRRARSSSTTAGCRPTRRASRRGEGEPTIAWFKDPAGNILSVVGDGPS